MSPELLSGAAAMLIASKCFFTGKPCLRGHIAERRVSNRTCRECEIFYEVRNPTRERLQQMRQRRDSKPPSDYMQRWREEHKPQLMAERRAYYNANPKQFKAAERRRLRKRLAMELT